VLALTDEQRAIAESVQGMLDRGWRVRSLLEDASVGQAGADLWRRLNRDFGLAGLLVPAELGGSGASAMELAVVAEQFGRTLCPAPLLPMLGSAVPMLVGLAPESSPAREILARVDAGDVVLTCAAPTAEVRVEADAPLAPGRTVSVEGTLGAVPARGAADTVLVPMRGEDSSTQLLAVGLDQPDVTTVPLESLDLSRPHVDLRLDSATGVVLGPVSGDVASAAPALARLIVAAEAVGVSAAALDIAVEYAKDRVAFGRPIGSFQAIKHRCAQMLIGLEQARSLVRYAAWAVADEDPGAELALDEAVWFAHETSIRLTADLIRVLGGIGFTWEHEAHLYYRRARAAALLFGDQFSRRERLAEELLA
jgi:alkylation response protein AidB-like acyl-CoA dehydrogenase